MQRSLYRHDMDIIHDMIFNQEFASIGPMLIFISVIFISHVYKSVYIFEKASVLEISSLKFGL